MPRINILKEDNPLFKHVNKRYSIQLEPFEKMLEMLNYSYRNFRKPALYKVVIYLKNEKQELSPVLDELKRLYVGNKSCPSFHYHWAREYKVDSTHYGMHYHFTFIGEARDRDGNEWNVRRRINHSLHLLQSRGWINNYSFSVPKNDSMKPHSLSACCYDPDRLGDLINWLSYNCKAETKEEVVGRKYGCSSVPIGYPIVNLPEEQARLLWLRAA